MSSVAVKSAKSTIMQNLDYSFMWQMVSYIPTTFADFPMPSTSGLPPPSSSAVTGAAAALDDETASTSGVPSNIDVDEERGVLDIPVGPGPVSDSHEDVTLLSAKLATSFFLESFIHSKEKLNIVQWVEQLTKKFDSSTSGIYVTKLNKQKSNGV